MKKDERLQHLKDLCEQAARLRDAADNLCKELTEQIERSRRLLERRRSGTYRPAIERRRKPRG